MLLRAKATRGETDETGPWNEGEGLHLVESEMTGGEGLDVTPYEPNPARKSLPSRLHPGG